MFDKKQFTKGLAKHLKKKLIFAKFVENLGKVIYCSNHWEAITNIQHKVYVPTYSSNVEILGNQI
jgi:hypothetical protein